MIYFISCQFLKLLYMIFDEKTENDLMYALCLYNILFLGILEPRNN